MNTLPSYLPKKFQRIHIELTNRCNFSCIFCPDGLMTRKRGFMPFSLACSALDRISELDLAEKVTFHVMGEPLLHPEFFRVLDHAASRNVPVGLTTNGALLKSDTIREIAGRDLYQIDISLQTPDRESFHATRGTRMDFEKYRDNLLSLLAACSTRPSPPIFKIRMMTTRFAGKMRKQLGVPNFMPDSATLQRTVLEWTERIYERLGLEATANNVKKHIGKIRIHGWNVIEIAPKIFIETYVLTDWGNAFAENNLIEANRGYCFGMRDHFAILYTGDVVLCCVDFDGKTGIGNLNDKNLSEILASPELEKIMEGFKTGKLVHPHCRRCLGTSSRLASWIKPVASVLGLKVLKPFFYRKYKLYE
ncbi:radical SAM/SPASM domain-containing protein [Desulfomonile tiedjei]|uniref:Radical SAM superfamily enzyme n=1 Tax=Desulfomonile tiedjei (strain ATCC 49306 / DSM 6799 / DCB-1) TaxID=706587 RepID=I4C3S4_DESTA|nr:radical SAM protein [Desulfomonile tiedjei]AFM24215.1 radical SAM superfamily enzyme [Desulfomonile tiedjei DSM 6799]